MKKSITRDEWSSLILFLAILFGAFLRFNPTMLAGFAINDGGMFSAMVDDLRANHWLIPAFTSYNHSNIPFAYPPLGFYFGAIAIGLFKISSVEAVRWIPAFFASLSIPAFYFLSIRLFKDKYHASLATLFFALMPRAFFWMIMGGGLTRAPGQFFMLLALGFIIQLFEENRRVDIFLSGLFAGLAVLSHPEAAVHTVLSAVLLWLVLSHNRITFMRSVFVGIIVLVITVPWWGTVIRLHGTAPLLSAIGTGGNPLAVFHLVFFTFTEEPYMTMIGVLGLIGIVRQFIRKEFLLPLWVLLPFIVAGRSATNLVIVPLAMLAAIGLTDVLLPSLQSLSEKETERSDQVTSIERNTLVYLLLYMVFSAYQFGFQLSNATLSKSEREAMEWVNQNTLGSSRFLVLSGETSVACDSVAEWFPALAGRQSLFTVQGTEWTLGNDFKSFIREAVDLQECSRDTLACVKSLVDDSDYEYVYFSKILKTDNCMPLGVEQNFNYFVENVRQTIGYEIYFENNDVLIFGKR